MQHLEQVTQLRQQGHRLTPQRLEVVKAVVTHSGHLTVEAIHHIVMVQQPFIDISTVYRIMQWLQTIGMVVSLEGADGLLRYEYRRQSDHHHHLVCKQCGQVLTLAEDVFAGAQVALQERYGFAAQIEHLAIPGVCAGCQGMTKEYP